MWNDSRTEKKEEKIPAVMFHIMLDELLSHFWMNGRKESKDHLASRTFPHEESPFGLEPFVEPKEAREHSRSLSSSRAGFGFWFLTALTSLQRKRIEEMSSPKV